MFDSAFCKKGTNKKYTHVYMYTFAQTKGNTERTLKEERKGFT